MEPGLLARWCLRVIDRYQGSSAAAVNDKSCPFTPSCCAFMSEAFRTRAFPIAFGASAWRLIRCNPLAHARSHDPVRSRGRRLRPNALRTMSVAMLTTGFALLLVQAAFAQLLAGGCTATVNGRDIRTMSAKQPLVVNKGQAVAVKGTAPAGQAAAEVSSAFRMVLIRDIAKVERTYNNGTGTTWGGSVNVDTYLKYGSGLYEVVGSAAGKGWQCTGTGYVKLVGASTAAWGAASLAALGALGGAASGGSKPKPNELGELGADLFETPSSSEEDLAAARGEDSVELTSEVRRNANYTATATRPCCALGLLPAMVMPIVGMGGGATPGAIVGQRIIRRKGRPVLGFFSGLIFGIGLTVLLQQRAVWVLTMWNAIVLPLVLAVLGAIRGIVGRRYKVIARSKA